MFPRVNTSVSFKNLCGQKAKVCGVVLASCSDFGKMEKAKYSIETKENQVNLLFDRMRFCLIGDMFFF